MGWVEQLQFDPRILLTAVYVPPILTSDLSKRVGGNYGGGAALERADPTRRVAAIGSGPYSSRQLIREVEEQSAMGTRIVDAIRLNGVFVETAITSGKIRPKDSPYSSLRAPDFDI